MSLAVARQTLKIMSLGLNHIQVKKGFKYRTPPNEKKACVLAIVFR